MAITLEELGLSKEELQDKVVDRICGRVMTESGYDEDGDEVSRDSTFFKAVTDKVTKQIAEKIDNLANAHILPNVGRYIEELQLQATTQWGEKLGAPVTFIEYLTQAADKYMTEKVNYEGKSKDEAGGYSWSPTQTRIAHMIHQHLHHSIKTAMEKALATANSSISQGLQETIKMKLQEVVASLKTEVKLK